MELITKSAEETKRFGQKLAADIISGKISGVIALEGELGSGKTTFVQGLAKGLGISSRIISPTFIILRSYELKDKKDASQIKNFYHIDLYRLTENIEDEILNLGIAYLWSDPGNVLVIEWAEKIRNLVPENATWIKFETIDERRRKITQFGKA